MKEINLSNSNKSNALIEHLSKSNSCSPDSKIIIAEESKTFEKIQDNNLCIMPSVSEEIYYRKNKFLKGKQLDSEGVLKDIISVKNFDKFKNLTKISEQLTKNDKFRNLKSGTDYELPDLGKITSIKNGSKEKIFVSINSLPKIKKKTVKGNKSNIGDNNNYIENNKHSSPEQKTEIRSRLKKVESSVEKKLDPHEYKNVHSKNLNVIKRLNEKNQEFKYRTTSEDPNKQETSFGRFIRIKKFFNFQIEEAHQTVEEKIYYYSILPGNSEVVRNCMKHRVNWKESSGIAANFRWQQSSSGMDFSQLNRQASDKQVFNHFEFHNQISNKLNLFVNLMKYCELKSVDVFQYMPMTVAIQYNHINYLKQFQNFKDFFKEIKDFVIKDLSCLKEKKWKRKYLDYFEFLHTSEKVGARTNLYINPTHYSGRNIWLVKAIDLNRGRCIKLADSIEKIEQTIKKFYNGVLLDFKEDEQQEFNTNFNLKKISTNSPGKELKYKTSSMIIQKYIESPLLYNGRKFDIRLWVLVTQNLQVHVFKEGHLKASSVSFDVNKIDSYIHLTNYSVQKYNEEFSKFEVGNEISFEEYQKFLEKDFPAETAVKNGLRSTYEKMCEIVKTTMFSVKDKLNIYDRKHCIEIFGYDFILDSSFKPYLLEINTNPGLEISSPLIKILLPRMIDDALRLTIDNMFNTKYSFVSDFEYQSPYPVKGYSNKENMWELVCELKDKKFNL